MSTSLTSGESSTTGSEFFLPYYVENEDTINTGAAQLTVSHADDTTTSVNLSSIIENVKNQLNEYKSLPLNWDGYEGEVFSNKVVSTASFLVDIIARFFIEERMIPEEITPCPLNDGSIDIEVGLKNKCLIFTLHPDRNEITTYSEDINNSYEEESNFGRIAVEEKLIWLVN